MELNLGNLPPAASLDERLVEDILKRRDEREAFLRFLRTIRPDGTSVFETIQSRAKISANEGLDDVDTDQLTAFLLTELKQRRNGSLSAYENLVYGMIASIDLNLARAQDKLARGKLSPRDMPKRYPVVRNNVELMLRAKILSGVGLSDRKLYLERKALKSNLQKMAGEMFFGVNKLGLEKDEILRYLNILFEIGILYEAEPICYPGFKEALGEAIISGEPVKLTHIKCLRFIYPQTGGVEILTHTEDVVVDGILGKYSPKSEVNLFPRLLNIKKIFEINGVKVAFKVILADEDLDLLFPEGNKYVRAECISRARGNVALYLQRLRDSYGRDFEFLTLSGLIERSRGDYKKMFASVLQDIHGSCGRYVNPDFFERSRVDHQYDYYQRLFGSSYTREEARRSISDQTASTIALIKCLRVIGDKVILIEEDRGGENKLIANGQAPILFVKLRDGARFGIQ